MSSLQTSFVDITKEVLRKMHDQQGLELSALMREVALANMIEVIFGVRDPQRKLVFSRAIKDFVRAGTPSLMLLPGLRNAWWPPWRRFRTAQEHLDSCIREEIRILRQRPDAAPDSVLQTMLMAKDQDGNGLTAEELRDELRTLIVAGHETTAVALTWMFYYMLRTRAIYQRVVDEVLSSASPLDSSLPYTEAVMQESLRIHAIAPFAFRTLGQSHIICGRRLPAGSNVALSNILIHRDPNVFPEPNRFNPERFLNKTYQAFEFLPFGSGVRRCIGSYFAKMEMRVVTATLLQAFDWRISQPTSVRVVLRHINAGPDRPIPVEAFARRPGSVRALASFEERR